MGEITVGEGQARDGLDLREERLVIQSRLTGQEGKLDKISIVSQGNF